MRLRGLGARLSRRRLALAALALALPATLSFSGSGLASPGGNSAATISGSFADSCRDFTAHSSKDISHVEIHYADGRVVEDESTTTPDYGIDGGPGDEIEFAIVKSGTTTETFVCSRANGPPTALLEIKTPDSECSMFFDSGLQCVQWVPRSLWRSSSDFPTDPGSHSDQEAGNLLWLCDNTFACSFTFDFRGTGSGDPEDDITSWSLDFGDGSSASGSWAADPPAAVAHTYQAYGGQSSSCADDVHFCVTLTVTDAAGQSDTDTITMAFIDVTPD